MRKFKPIPLDLMNTLFGYEQGHLVRKKKAGQRGQAGARAGTINAKGYVVIKVEETSYLAHRIIWAMHYGDPGNLFVDHINGKTTDNRIENLRAVPRSVNVKNTKEDRSTKTGVLGVSINKNGNFAVSLKHKGSTIYGGTYKTKHEARNVSLTMRSRLNDGFNSERFETFEEYDPRMTSFDPRGKSRFLNVCFDERTGKWLARSSISGSRVRVGSYLTEESASEAVMTYENAVMNGTSEEWMRENSLNMVKINHKNNTSGRRGVTYNKKAGTWQVKYRGEYRGTRDTFEDACILRDSAERSDVRRRIPAGA